ARRADRRPRVRGRVAPQRRRARRAGGAAPRVAGGQPMSGSLAPVLSRIAEIETRISGAPPVSALDTTSTESSPAAGFDAAYDAALAEYPTATAGTWTGVGSQGW